MQSRTGLSDCRRGEQQRFAFARIFLLKPALLFLDEATSALDESSEAQLYRLLRTASWRPTIVSVGHRGTLRGFHDQFLEISAFVEKGCREGRLVDGGEPSGIDRHPKSHRSFVARLLGAAGWTLPLRAHRSPHDLLDGQALHQNRKDDQHIGCRQYQLAL